MPLNLIIRLCGKDEKIRVLDSAVDEIDRAIGLTDNYLGIAHWGGELPMHNIPAIERFLNEARRGRAQTAKM